MKVKMLVQTQWNGAVKPGDIVDVPKDVAERWQKNNIAEMDKAEPPKREPRRKVEEIEQ